MQRRRKKQLSQGLQARPIAGNIRRRLAAWPLNPPWQSLFQPTPSLFPVPYIEQRASNQTIEAGRKTFVEVGLALAEIRDSRLYRSDHATFEEYCDKKWHWKRAYCYQLIEGAAVVKALPPEMSTVVDNQRQARELAKVEPANRVYRADFSTFEEYCRAKWNWDRTYCHRIIEASQTVKLLPIGNKPQIQTESQARELAKVEPANRVSTVLTSTRLKRTAKRSGGGTELTLTT